MPDESDLRNKRRPVSFSVNNYRCRRFRRFSLMILALFVKYPRRNTTPGTERAVVAVTEHFYQRNKCVNVILRFRYLRTRCGSISVGLVSYLRSINLHDSSKRRQSHCEKTQMLQEESTS